MYGEQYKNDQGIEPTSLAPPEGICDSGCQQVARGEKEAQRPEKSGS
jgi:hypothetical protein